MEYKYRWLLRLYIYLYIYLIYFLTHTFRILRNTNSKNVILLRKRILFLNLSQGYEKKFDRLRKDSYTSFVYETIQLCQLASLMAEKAIVLEEPFYMSYLLRPPKFQWPRFAINAWNFSK